MNEKDGMRVGSILLVGIPSLFVAGCGASSVPVESQVAADGTGWVDRATTGSTGIQGQWHVYRDTAVSVTGVTAASCQTAPAGECSIVTDPAPEFPYAPTPGRGMCTSGVIAQWITGSNAVTPDGSPGWAGIALDLDQSDWPAPRSSTNAPAARPYDAISHGVSGFGFDIEPGSGASMQEAPADMRVVMAAVGHEANPAWWGGAAASSSPVGRGRNEVRWNDVGGSESASSFDPTQLLRIGFLAAGNDSQATSYAFCVNHLVALTGSGGPSNSTSSADASARARRSKGQLLAPDNDGWVDRRTTGKTQIQGQWFAASDGDAGSCQAAGHAECSHVSEPDPRTLGFPRTRDLGMCTSGVVAQVVAGSGTPYDYDSIWGAEIGFLLNSTGPPEWRSDPYDTVQGGVIGFAFDIDSEPPPGAELRVGLPTEEMGKQPAFWSGKTADRSPVHAGHNEFTLDEVAEPSYVPNAAPLNRKKIRQITFHVPSVPAHAVSFRFCINNLTALVE